MPIVTIEPVLLEQAHIAAETTRQLADQFGELFGTPVSTTWVKINPISSRHYAENGTPAEQTPAPVFVTVLKRALTDESFLAAEAMQIGDIIASELNVSSEHVHVAYEPPAAGRMSFGGNWVSEENERAR